MPRAIFVSDFDYRTPRKAIIAYKAGYRGSITTKAYEAALAAGAIEPPPPENERGSDGAIEQI